MSTTGDPRQRRGKTSPAANGAGGTYISPAQSRAATAEERNDKMIRDAMAKVVVANDRCIELHSQWRGYLLKAAYLVLLLSLHQANGPVKDCIGDVKALNSAMADGGDAISGLGAFGLVLTDGLSGLIGIVMAALVVKFITLENPVGDFTSHIYIASAAMVPMCVSLFFQADRTAGASCVAGHEHASLIADMFNDDGRAHKQLPVPVVYHAIVTVAYWFMKRGRDQCEKNVVFVQGLLKTMAATKARNAKLRKEREEEYARMS